MWILNLRRAVGRNGPEESGAAPGKAGLEAAWAGYAQDAHTLYVRHREQQLVRNSGRCRAVALTSASTNIYSALSFNPPPAQYTVAASFFLTSPSKVSPKVISIATGTKCLPTSRYPLKGEALHDSHAEVLARRGAIRWFLEEIGRCESSGTYKSSWIHRDPEGKYDLREGVQVSLYVSTMPCGDASMRFLAAVQDEEMAALKDSAVYAPLGPNEASRGRDNYARLGVLRTKPGRADSPPTFCMSCSDKIASWSILGFQGALGSRFLRPLYISTIVIGEVPLDMQDIVREDCERAFWRRLGHVDEELHPGYSLHVPVIKFTAQPFVHSRTVLGNTTPLSGSCNDALCWTADTEPKPYEVLINGFKRGVSPKHRFHEKARPRLSRIAVLALYNRTLGLLGLPPLEPTTTYHALKQQMSDYQAVKEKLMGPNGVFSGWISSVISTYNCIKRWGEKDK
ncbi:putative adenosine-deaminase (editase) [Lyophyllum shimeji]|uniref:Adenosine-deaminase (Editase) n=1 Tax=Lyophyllum shimeji TaxID=47721 RepID=A0A9P3UHX9_LYOSH|nr:putative adenosine-deaminase (editase) [Lyophyllum shimeji]